MQAASPTEVPPNFKILSGLFGFMRTIGAVGKKRRGKRRGRWRFRMQNPAVARGKRVMLDLGIYFASQSASTLGFSGRAPNGKERDGRVEFCLPYQFLWVRLLRIASLTSAGSCQGTS